MSETAGTSGETTSSADDPVPGEGDPVATGTKGGGEWPSRDAPPTGPAPGTDPALRDQLEAGRARLDQVEEEGSAAELHPPARYADGLEEDPEVGGSGSIGS